MPRGPRGRFPSTVLVRQEKTPDPGRHAARESEWCRGPCKVEDRPGARLSADHEPVSDRWTTTLERWSVRSPGASVRGRNSCTRRAVFVARWRSRPYRLLAMAQEHRHRSATRTRGSRCAATAAVAVVGVVCVVYVLDGAPAFAAASGTEGPGGTVSVSASDGSSSVGRPRHGGCRGNARHVPRRLRRQNRCRRWESLGVYLHVVVTQRSRRLPYRRPDSGRVVLRDLRQPAQRGQHHPDGVDSVGPTVPPVRPSGSSGSRPPGRWPSRRRTPCACPHRTCTSIRPPPRWSTCPRGCGSTHRSGIRCLSRRRRGR